MGGLTQRTATQQIPQDIAGMRQSNLNLLNYVLFGQQGQATSPGNPINLFKNVNPGSPATRFSQGGDVNQRLTNVFGNLAPPGISQFINQPTPEQQALNTAMPALNEVLSGNPSNNPVFQQDLSVANQQGGRFGSANAILRGQALTGLFSQRNQAANVLGMLSGQAGQGQARQAGLMDLETQRRLQLLMSLLGTSQSASFNLPFVQQPSTLDTLGQLAGTVVAGKTGGLLGGGGGGNVSPAGAPANGGFYGG